MINYKVLQVDEYNFSKQFILVTNANGSKTSFEATNSNPNYISFLRQLSQENPEDPHYTEWVEAGNNPEDFWVQEQQDDALEDSEPKEEE